MISENKMTIKGREVHFLESGEEKGKDILLLHGMKFNSETWKETGILAFLGEKGFHAVAVDLPGFGKSPANDLGKPETLKAVIEISGLSEPVVIAPSMSGGYSLPVIAEGAVKLGAYVAVAPTNIPDFIEALEGNPLKTLAIWGSNDEIVPPENADILCNAMPNATKVIIEDGGHPTYLTETEKFLQYLIGFLESL